MDHRLLNFRNDAGDAQAGALEGRPLAETRDYLSRRTPRPGDEMRIDIAHRRSLVNAIAASPG